MQCLVRIKQGLGYDRPMPEHRMLRILGRTLWAALAVILLGALLLLGRAFHARQGPALQPWHRIVLEHEVHAAAIGADYTWADYLHAEGQVFAELQRKLAAQPVPGKYRYESDSPLGARPGQRDWNRSFESTPGEVHGGVLLLHGLTDSPYSVRYLAEVYQRAGYAVIAPRLPGHGTVPAGLLDVRWQDWMAVVRLAMRELRTRVGPGKPLHIVGYSNGAALAMKYAMDSVERDDDTLPRAQRLVLVSPMIGVSPAARWARLLPVFGGIDYFEQSKWIDVLPEFNPYKYNSFPANGAVQSYLLTAAVQAQLQEQGVRGRRGRLPPILAFQSVLDNTVSTGDVVHMLFDRLPANGSELVLFDINRASLLAPLLQSSASGFADTLYGEGPRNYRLTLVSNLNPQTLEVGERVYAPGARVASEQPLSLAFPAAVYSLSHVALPFPMDDPLYGLQPRTDEDYGIRLGTLALHGERGALLVKADQFQRLGCNPFFPYLARRIAEGAVPYPDAAGRR